MTECQRCSAKAELFLCNACISDLRDLLRGLVHNRWIEYLQDEAWGATRKGESARRSNERNSPLPVNLRASELLNNIHAALARLVQELCENRGVDLP